MHDQQAYTIAEFCAVHRISRAQFYKLVNAGTAPRLMTVGARKFISAEAAADWRQQMEQSANAEHDRERSDRMKQAAAKSAAKRRAERDKVAA